MVGMLGCGAASAHSNRSLVRLAVTPERDALALQALVVFRGDREPVVDEFVLAEITGSWGSRSLQLQPDRRTPGYFRGRVHLPSGRWNLRVSTKAATVGSAGGELTVGPDGRLEAANLSAAFDPASVLARPAADAGGHLGRTVGLTLACGFGLLLAVVAARTRAASRQLPAQSAQVPNTSRV
jgi:hypothetical protein